MIYILGDMLKKGSILMRNYEASVCRDLGYEVYSAIEQKDINDKQNQTVESNNNLAERIVDKDSNAIRLSNIIIAEVDNNNVGSCVEIGQIMEFNWWHDNVNNILHSDDPIGGLEKFLDNYPKKKCYFHTTDIRHTNLPEVGYRRSFSFNQYLVGACLYLNKKGITTFEHIIDELRIDKNILQKLYNKLLGR